MLSNWVERRAARERNLKNASEVWGKACESITEACNSLRRLYPDLGHIRATMHGRNMLRIVVRSDETLDEMLVSVEFRTGDLKIVATAGSERILEFVVDADCDHGFVAFKEREILFDELSQLIMEDVVFMRQQPPGSLHEFQLMRQVNP